MVANTTNRNVHCHYAAETTKIYILKRLIILYIKRQANKHLKVQSRSKLRHGKKVTLVSREQSSQSKATKKAKDISNKPQQSRRIRH